jgi:hypothetical protein
VLTPVKNPPERRPVAEALVRAGWRAFREDADGVLWWERRFHTTAEHPQDCVKREDQIPDEDKR